MTEAIQYLETRIINAISYIESNMQESRVLKYKGYHPGKITCPKIKRFDESRVTGAATFNRNNDCLHCQIITHALLRKFSDIEGLALI